MFLGRPSPQKIDAMPKQRCSSLESPRSPGSERLALEMSQSESNGDTDSVSCPTLSISVEPPSSGSGRSGAVSAGASWGSTAVTWEFFAYTPGLSPESFLDTAFELGQGRYGSVVEVRLADSGKPMAMKLLSLTAESKPLLLNEQRILQELRDSPFVPRLHMTKQVGDKVHFVMDKVAGGTLAEALSGFTRMSEDAARRYTAELVLAVTDLHRRNIVHRDLHSQNIMFDKDGHLKIIDMGRAIARDDLPAEYTVADFESARYKDVKRIGRLAKEMLDVKNRHPFWNMPSYVSPLGKRFLIDIQDDLFTIEAVQKHPWFHHIPQFHSINWDTLIQDDALPIEWYNEFGLIQNDEENKSGEE